MTSPIIALEDVDLTLVSRAGPVNILRSVSLEVQAGQALAIVGPSGSGKTSLLMIMAGLERPTRGKVAVAGRNISGMSEDELARLRRANIGIVFQSFHLVPTMTALENVALPLELAGAGDAFEIAGSLLDDVGLTPRRHHFPAELSGGEQQRVAIARAMSRQPRVILADEPTGNLDGTTGRQIIDTLFRLREKTGATLVLVTHDERLAGATERIVRMRDGIVASDDMAKAAPKVAAQ